MSLLAALSEAGNFPPPHPLQNDPEVKNYLSTIQRQNSNVEMTTTNPNGNRRGRLGDLVVFNNSGSYKLCLNIDTGSGGTTWRCTANAFTAP